ncbi:uracil-DNA glycosylase [Undibacterium sp. TS12]|uniref:uracil-DNA glycosylase n=1 Tax=Undibacterium sp. TS12 TaxID=2908202 RepID=UPI001F4D0350|nr:uracil-DNA glycosylase [Undibacterium sp. TS12]MCH8618844.1 uracil-DNA glycosylase [Undibacterium sp. TS12]
MTGWSEAIPEDIRLSLQQVHPSWSAVIEAALQQVHERDPAYFASLHKSAYLPDQARLFAAFSIPMQDVRYILIGEGPYPRADSATGYCFMDGAVNRLWSDEEGGGLSKKVNRATSLRNFMKMLLVTSGHLQQDATTGEAMAAVASHARNPASGIIQTLGELQQNMISQGFLLLNASLVFREDTPPAKDARAWLPFLQTVLARLYQERQTEQARSPVLVLWGKIAEQLRQIPEAVAFEKICAEHPYNLSFIGNASMQEFFKPMALLKRIA